MADNTLKLNQAKALNQTAINRAGDAIAILGKSLPCVVAALNPPGAVTISFQVTSPFTIPNVIIPVGWSEYMRLPIQVGCPGVCVAMDAVLGGVSGLGAGTASLTAPPANLGALVFFPIGRKNWQTEDPNTLVLYGEPGVAMQTKTNDCSVSCNGGTVTITGATINLTGTVMINGETYHMHMHTGVQPGSGDTGPVTP